MVKKKPKMRLRKEKITQYNLLNYDNKRNLFQKI